MYATGAANTSQKSLIVKAGMSSQPVEQVVRNEVIIAATCSLLTGIIPNYNVSEKYFLRDTNCPVILAWKLSSLLTDVLS